MKKRAEDGEDGWRNWIIIIIRWRSNDWKKWYTHIIENCV